MARKATWPPKRTLHASGQEKVRWKGRDYYLGLPGTAAADEAYRKLLLQLAPTRPIGIPAPIPVEIVTVEGVVARWRVEELPRYAKTSREPSQFYYSVQPLLALFGSTPAAEFDAAALEQLQLAMASGSWNGKPGWNRNVVNRRIVRLRTIWRWAERRKLVPMGAWSNLQSLRGLSGNDARVRQSGPRGSVTEEQLAKIIAKAKRVVGAMLRLQWLTGMRSGEVRIMRGCDIDQSTWIYTPSRHKMQHRGQTRRVLLDAEAQEIVKVWMLKKSPTAYLFPPATCRPNGNPCYTDNGYAQAARRAADKAGVPGFHPYMLRHAAKQRLTRLFGLDVARAVLGQKSLGTTNDYGDAMDLTLAEEAMKKSG